MDCVNSYRPMPQHVQRLIVCAQVWHPRYQAQVIKAERFRPYDENPHASGKDELYRITKVCFPTFCCV